MDNGETRTETLNAILRSAREEWLGRPGVVGVDLGLPVQGGKSSSETVLRVHVRKKKPEDDLSEGELLPRRFEGLDVHVVEATYGEQTRRS